MDISQENVKNTDQRRWGRIAVDVEAWVRVIDGINPRVVSKPTKACCRNISFGGLCLIMESPVVTDLHITGQPSQRRWVPNKLEVQIPLEGEQWVKFFGTVAWFSQDEPNNSYMVGVETYSIVESHQGLLARLMVGEWPERNRERWLAGELGLVLDDVLDGHITKENAVERLQKLLDPGRVLISRLHPD